MDALVEGVWMRIHYQTGQSQEFFFIERSGSEVVVTDSRIETVIPIAKINNFELADDPYGLALIQKYLADGNFSRGRELLAIKKKRFSGQDFARDLSSIEETIQGHNEQNTIESARKFLDRDDPSSAIKTIDSLLETRPEACHLLEMRLGVVALLNDPIEELCTLSELAMTCPEFSEIREKRILQLIEDFADGRIPLSQIQDNGDSQSHITDHVLLFGLYTILFLPDQEVDLSDWREAHRVLGQSVLAAFRGQPTLDGSPDYLYLCALSKRSLGKLGRESSQVQTSCLRSYGATHLESVKEIPLNWQSTIIGMHLDFLGQKVLESLTRRDFQNASAAVYNILAIDRGAEFSSRGSESVQDVVISTSKSLYLRDIRIVSGPMLFELADVSRLCRSVEGEEGGTLLLYSLLYSSGRLAANPSNVRQELLKLLETRMATLELDLRDSLTEDETLLELKELESLTRSLGLVESFDTFEKLNNRIRRNQAAASDLAELRRELIDARGYEMILLIQEKAQKMQADYADTSSATNIGRLLDELSIRADEAFKIAADEASQRKQRQLVEEADSVNKVVVAFVAAQDKGDMSTLTALWDRRLANEMPVIEGTLLDHSVEEIILSEDFVQANVLVHLKFYNEAKVLFDEKFLIKARKDSGEWKIYYFGGTNG